DHHVPSRSLWIGNIDSNLGQEELFNIFSPFGSIESIRMLPDKECAFINYAHVEDAIRAREDMQGGRVGNCIIRIGYGKSDTAHDTQGMQPTKSLWIGNISPNMKPSDLEAVFTPFGQVESARVLTHKNCGFVNFVHLEDAITARAELNGQEVSGNIIKIGFAKVPTKQESSTSVTSSSTDYQSPEGSPWRNTSPNRPPASMAHRQSSFSRSFNESHHSTLVFILTIEVYATAIPPIPEPNPNRKADQNRLREIRKRLEGHCSNRELDTIFSEIIDDAVDLCSVIQKVVEKCNDAQRQRLIDTVGPHLAALGIHKNGTWAVQKIIECARTPSQMESIANALKQYTPPLLLDQFGNYVVQCCLRLSGQKNQFVFDAMCNKCWDLGQGRFGARAIRTCLESQFTTKRQQKEVSNSILHYCVQLSMNPNGNILVTWLMELSSLPGRYRALASKMAPHVALLSCHKLASTSILKLVNQRLEMDAREQVIKEIFLKERNLQQIMADHAHGVGVIQKILSAGCVSPEERTRLADLVRLNCHRMDENHIGYKRLMEELASIPRETQELTPQSSPKRHEPIRQHSQNRLRQ
ncbi:armadillo-type protein, partial [Gorgonomyces haynaldii]